MVLLHQQLLYLRCIIVAVRDFFQVSSSRKADVFRYADPSLFQNNLLTTTKDFSLEINTKLSHNA